MLALKQMLFIIPECWQIKKIEVVIVVVVVVDISLENRLILDHDIIFLVYFGGGQ